MRTNRTDARTGLLTGLAALIAALLTGPTALLANDPPEQTIRPLETFVDLDRGQEVTVTLSDGSTATLKLLAIQDERDSTPQRAVRRAIAIVEVNGERLAIASGNYNLPVEVAGVQIDSPVTAAYLDNSRRNVWQLEKDARFRLWPADSPRVEPGTFIYPIRQRFFATFTQATNAPTYTTGGDNPTRRNIYYHEGFDIGGHEGRTEVISATDGVVVSLAGRNLPDVAHPPQRMARYDVVYIRDDRGWYYRYSHLKTIDPDLRLGQRVRMGQNIGILGKEGASGGWAHLHLGLTVPMPDGRLVEMCPYVYTWDAYLRDHDPAVIAVARPQHLVYINEPVLLDARRSWVRQGEATFQWTLTSGATHEEPLVRTRYSRPGIYSEILRVSDGEGNVAYDFAVVQVVPRNPRAPLPPILHAAHHPTTNIRAGDPVHFTVRTFGIAKDEGEEVWDFGDGSEPVTTNSNPHRTSGSDALDPDGYAETVHRFEQPGDYIVTVQRTGAHGMTAIGRLHVHVEPRGAD